MEKIKKLKNKRIVITGIILILLCSIAFSQKKIQNDTFYTLKIGEYISKNGILNLKSDVFSWHDNLPYTYPHWLYDLMMFGIFKIGSWNGIYISTIAFQYPPLLLSITISNNFFVINIKFEDLVKAVIIIAVIIATIVIAFSFFYIFSTSKIC